MSGVASIADVLALERERCEPLPNSTYEMIGAAARTHPDAPALSFFARVEDHARPQVWNYETLFARITATANFLHGLGVDADDAEGYFHLTGRKKELIIRGGHNIDPASIEEPLHRHPAVQIVAAVGRPDVHVGELPVAYVQLKPGARATEDELLSFARDQIGERAAIPKAIRLVSAMPLTGVGKIFKPELRQREIADALYTALRDAGVSTSRLEVINEPRFGIQVEVAVADSVAAGIAREVLGRYPFRFEVSCPVMPATVA